jgi:hypothetical protein
MSFNADGVEIPPSTTAFEGPLLAFLPGLRSGASGGG